MGVANRDYDASEQNMAINSTFTEIDTGKTLCMWIAPWQGVVKQIKASADGLSGSPVLAFRIIKFIAGAGASVIGGGATNLTLAANGTSGIQSFVLGTAGSTLLQFSQGDLLCVTTSGANTGADVLTTSLVVQALQDFKSYFGTSYS